MLINDGTLGAGIKELKPGAAAPITKHDEKLTAKECQLIVSNDLQKTWASSKTADSDTVSTYQVSSVQLVTDKKLEAFNKA